PPRHHRETPRLPSVSASHADECASEGAGRWCAGVLALPCGGFGNAPSDKVELGRADYDTSTECYDPSTREAGPLHRAAAGRAPGETPAGGEAADRRRAITRNFDSDRPYGPNATCQSAANSSPVRALPNPNPGSARADVASCSTRWLLPDGEGSPTTALTTAS